MNQQVMETTAPMIEVPVPQGWDVEVREADGAKVAVLLAMTPFATMRLALDKAASDALIERLRGVFSDLTIASQLPPSLGAPR